MSLFCDLSNNNPEPDWRRLRQSVAGVWLKASEGDSFRDPTWTERSQAARAAGLRVGGYHFARPSSQPGSAVLQAEFFQRQRGRLRRRDLRPALDLEVTGALAPGALERWARAFSQRTRELCGVYPLLYCSPSFAESSLRASRPVGAGLWLADYGPDDGLRHPPHLPAPWKHYVAHQFTSRGRLAAVRGPVDLDYVPRLRGVLAFPWRGLLP